MLFLISQGNVIKTFFSLGGIVEFGGDTYSQVLNEFIFKVMLLCLDPGLLIALKKQVDRSVSEDEKGEEKDVFISSQLSLNCVRFCF